MSFIWEIFWEIPKYSGNSQIFGKFPNIREIFGPEPATGRNHWKLVPVPSFDHTHLVTGQ